MTFRIDGALYPDCDPPRELTTLADRLDFVARLCSAWDFGVLPDMETIAEVRRILLAHLAAAPPAAETPSPPARPVRQRARRHA